MSYIKKSFCFLLLTLSCQAMESPFKLVQDDKLDELKERLKDVLAVPELRDEEGNSLLHYVKSVAMAEFLLGCRVNVNNQNPTGNTPMHSVMFNSPNGNFPVVSVLLDAGADITLVNEDKHTPVHHIVSHNFEFLIKFFSKVPKCVITKRLKEQRVLKAYTLMLCLKKLKETKLLDVPKDIQKMLAQYCLYQPYYEKLHDEQLVVTKIVEDKIGIIKRTLEIKDLDAHIPRDHLIFIWPEDKQELLNPERPEQYGQGILDSVEAQFMLENHYEYDLNNKVVKVLSLVASPLPSIE